MSIEAMKLALEAFKYADSTDHDLQRKAIIALEQAIALQNLTDTHQEMEVSDAYQRAWKAETTKQTEQAQPVAWRTFDGEGGYDYRTYDSNEGYAQEWATRNPRHVSWVDALYTAPPQRQWVGLTDDEIKEIIGPWGETPIKGYTRKMFDQIEAKLQEKNR